MSSVGGAKLLGAWLIVNRCGQDEGTHCFSHLLIQILITLIQVLVLQAPLVLNVDVSVEFSCQSLVEL